MIPFMPSVKYRAIQMYGEDTRCWGKIYPRRAKKNLLCAWAELEKTYYHQPEGETL
jgi:hypothetical protein